MDENNYCVYKHTCIENGKVYYGITNDYLTRWNNGFGYQSNKCFFDDIVKYGWCNFKHEILIQNISKEKASFLESLLIQETFSYVKENGYNQTMGQYFPRIEITEENEDDDWIKIERRGAKGRPVVYDGKIYKNIKALQEEIGEDYNLLVQSLNPNCLRKMPQTLIEHGLHYATNEELPALEDECE